MPNCSNSCCDGYVIIKTLAAVVSYVKFNKYFTVMEVCKFQLSACLPKKKNFCILGSRCHVDVCTVHRGNDLMRISANAISYGWLGDVLSDSERFRFMGPFRYQYSGIHFYLFKITILRLCYILVAAKLIRKHFFIYLAHSVTKPSCAFVITEKRIGKKVAIKKIASIMHKTALINIRDIISYEMNEPCFSDFVTAGSEKFS